MGVRDMAAAAVEAQQAARVLQQKQNQQRHGTTGLALVQSRLGLTGKVSRARKDAPQNEDEWGQDTVVRIDDDGGPLFIAVRIQSQWERSDSLYGRRDSYRTGSTTFFELVGEDTGQDSHKHPHVERRVTADRWEALACSLGKFTDLAGMAKLLAKYDGFVGTDDFQALYNIVGNSGSRPENLRMRSRSKK